MAPSNAKIKKACKAMAVMGIPEVKVKAVLKILLKTYDNKWNFIEDDNYKLLLDAILDVEETETKKKEEKKESRHVGMNRGKKKALESQLVVEEEEEEEETDENEIPLTRRVRTKRQRGCDYNESLHLGIPISKKAREEDNASLKLGTPVLKKEREEENGNLSLGSPMLKKEREEDNESLRLDSPMLEKERKEEPKPEEENDDNGMTELPPLKRYLRRTSGGGSAIKNITRGRSDVKEGVQKTLHCLDAGNCSSSALEMEKSVMCVEEQNGETKVNPRDMIAIYVPPSAVGESSEPKFATAAAAALDLASSASGEAKICLSFAPAAGETTALHLPSLEDVRKAMEEKCLKSYKIVDPSFSFLGLMNDMCSCYVELATKSTNQSLKTETVPDMVNAANDSGAADISMGLVVVPECEISAAGWRAISNINDITDGAENIEIPWVNEINDEVPSHFGYIPESLVFKDAAVKVSVSSFSDEQCCFSCIGNCLDSSGMSCKCTIPYTLDGVLKDDLLEERVSEVRDIRKQVLEFCQECPLEKTEKEKVLEPCQGHIKRKAIKECWIKCACAKRCVNRVVQRGIHSKLEVFYTPNGKGWGLRTKERIPKGAFVCEYIGEILTISELHQRSFEGKLTSPVILDANWSSEEVLEDNKALCLDGTRFGNISRFINHRCLDPNLIEIPVQVDTPDQHYYHLAFFTTRDIEAMEELTREYGIDFDDDDESLMKPFDCMCGSRFCRTRKRSKKAKKLMVKA